MSIERNPDDIPTLESNPPEAGAGTASPQSAQPPAPELTEDATLERDLFVGRRIGSYLVRSQIGRGGMGAVYLGEHPRIGSKVAIKFLHPKFASDRRVVERFFNEARAVNLIGHPNILRIHDLDSTSDGYHYCVMEHLEGQTLQAFLRARGKLSLQDGLPILEGLCAGLGAAHARGIVHRDLKPENVFLVTQGDHTIVKVVDFGIAKLTNRPVDSLNTVTGTVIGTPAYMSPEQAEGEGDEIDARSDLYSLGVLAFQMFTGSLPFQGAFGRMLVAHISLAPPSPRQFDPSISPALERLILRALAKNPIDRPQTTADFLSALQACAAEPAKGQRRLGRPFSKRTSGKFSLRNPTPGVTENPTPNRTARSVAMTMESAPPAVTPSDPLFAAIPPPPNRWVSALTKISMIAVIGAVSYLYAWPWAHKQFEEIQADRAVNRDLPPGSPNTAIVQFSSRLPEEAYSAAASKAISDAALANQMAQGNQVTLFLVSEPLGARTVCGWQDGRVDGVTPMKCVVPKGARVHLESYAVDYAPGSKDIVASSAQAVSITLMPKQAK